MREMPERPRDSIAWWSARRRKYNYVLVASLAAAIVIDLVAVGAAPRQFPGFEITLVSFVAAPLWLGFGMLLANICYLPGLLAEHLLRPRDAEGCREFPYKMGLGFSIGIILAPSILTIAKACSAIKSL